MPGSNEIDAHKLLRASLRSPIGVTRTEAVLPFFTQQLVVKMLLVVMRDGGLFVTRELPQHVTWRTLVYSFPPRLGRALAEVHPRELKPLFHFDPWWLLRERKDVPDAVREAAIATNIAGSAVADGELRKLYFDDALTAVVAARTRDRFVHDDELGILTRA